MRILFHRRGGFAILLSIMLGFTAYVRAEKAPPLATLDYWRGLKANGYQLPEAADALAHAQALIRFSDAVDPSVRDDIGYEFFWRWVHKSGRLKANDLDALRAELLPRARKGLGERESDSIFGRSFAMIFLKELVSANRKVPFLTNETRAELVQLSIDTLANEKDLRGYVPAKGWAHSTGHSADLMASLLRDPVLSPTQIAAMVRGVRARLANTDTGLVWAEDARLGMVLALSVIRAEANTAQVFEEWVTSLQSQHKSFWGGPFSADAYHRLRAQTNTLVHAIAILHDQALGDAAKPVFAMLTKVVKQIR